jgi:UDP-N-acetylmuramyl pentapeptide phosphotransferase/UDP-N-acetylglucosamine-1-phosphate transferase
MIILIGLVLIIIGWAEQVWRVLVRRHRSFSPFFLAFYMVGSAMLAAGNFQENEIVFGVLFVITIVAAFIVLINVIVKRKNPEVF